MSGVRCLIVCACVLIGGVVVGAEGAATRFDRAVESLGRASELASDDPEGTRLARAAAAGFSALLKEDGYDSAALRRNLAIAQLRLGEHGRAIANLHHARVLGAHDGDTQRLLGIARAGAGVDRRAIEHATAYRVVRTVDEFLPRHARMWMSIGFAGLGWALVAFGAWGAGGARLRALQAGALMVLATAVVSTVVGAEVVDRRETVGVVIADEAITRTGPGARGFPAAFDEPLRAGVEFRVLDERARWTRAEFGDGSSAWVRTNDVEVIR